MTIAIGCSLLVLNVLIFATVYYQRETMNDDEGDVMAQKTKKKKAAHAPQVQTQSELSGEKLLNCQLLRTVVKV